MSAHISNVRPKPDAVLTDIANYAAKGKITSKQAYETARYCLMDTLGCGLEALEYPACTKLLGPIVPGTVVPNGAKVPGTQFQPKALVTVKPAPTALPVPRRLVEAFAEAHSQGLMAIDFEGQMVDVPHLASARRLIDKAEQISIKAG